MPRPSVLDASVTVLLATLWLWPGMASGQQADAIYYNGHLVTVDDAFSIAQAMAVKAGRIQRVGSDADVLALKGDDTQLVDLHGQTVLPALLDSHTHPANASMFEFDHEVPDMQSIADVLDYIHARTKVVPLGDWIVIEQVFITRLREQRYPTRAELDEAAPDHPVVFSTGPDASVNSLALSLSGITRESQPAGEGRVEMDPGTNQPTGILRGRAKSLLKVEPIQVRATEAQRRERLRMLFHDYNSVGITSISDRNATSDDVTRYLSMREASELTVRVAISHAVAAGRETPISQSLSEINDVARHPLRHGSPELRIVGVKTFQDGGMLTGSAYMLQPWGVSQIYSITDPLYRGVLFINKQDLRQLVQATIEAGLQFTAHTVGDGAVTNLLDVYQELSHTLPVRKTRPCITHCNFMTKDAVQQMASLGVVADIQPAWLYLDAWTLNSQFGYDRLAFFQPLHSLCEAGAVVGGGSDHMQKIGSFRSINPYNPFLGMWITITRSAQRYDGPMHPEQALSREQAIRMYTSNNARLLFLEDEVGSLAPDKAADFIVLDRDILHCPVNDIRAITVLATYKNGNLIYQAANAIE